MEYMYGSDKLIMQQAIPYRPWAPQHTSPPSSSSSPSCSTVTTSGGGGGEDLKIMIAENPVLVVGRRGCCMCHVAKRLLQGLGVNPAVCEVGEEIDETSLIDEYTDQDQDQRQQQIKTMMMFPVVFIGGRLVGGLDRLMAVHISGDLVPILKVAGALWL